MVSAFSRISLHQSFQPYRGSDSIDNKAASTFVILAGIGDQDGHFGVFVENLLNPAVVNTLSWVLFACCAIGGFLGIAEIIRMSDIVWRIQVGISAGGRSRIMLVNGYRGSEICSEPGERWDLRGESAAECNESDR